MPITIDGSLADWTTGRLDTAPDGVTNYALYGQFSNSLSSYVFAISAPVAITDGTTLWFDTDLNTATGHLVFGYAVGAEYNVNIVGGLPYLYTGAAAENFVSGPLTHAFSGDSKILEVAVPKASIGNPTSLRVFIDVNNATFLPNDYTLSGYTVTDVEPSSNVTLVHTRFNDSTDTFGTGTIVGGSRTLVQTRFNDSTDTFGTGEIRSGISLVGTLFDDADTFGGGLVTPGSMTLEQVHFADEDVFWPDSFIEAGAPPFGAASWTVVTRVAETLWTEIDPT